MADMGKDPGYHVGDGGSGMRKAPPRTDFEYGNGGDSHSSPEDGNSTFGGTSGYADAIKNFDTDADSEVPMDRVVRSEGSRS